MRLTDIASQVSTNFEDRHQGSIPPGLDTKNQYVAGFGSGVLAAVAASCATNREDLLVHGHEFVIMAFRIGMLAADARSYMGSAVEDERAWRVRVYTENAAQIGQLLDVFASVCVIQLVVRHH